MFGLKDENIQNIHLSIFQKNLSWNIFDLDLSENLRNDKIKSIKIYAYFSL
jgi:hypothetical protein